MHGSLTWSITSLSFCRLLHSENISAIFSYINLSFLDSICTHTQKKTVFIGMVNGQHLHTHKSHTQMHKTCQPSFHTPSCLYNWTASVHTEKTLISHLFTHYLVFLDSICTHTHLCMHTEYTMLDVTAHRVHDGSCYQHRMHHNTNTPLPQRPLIVLIDFNSIHFNSVQ